MWEQYEAPDEKSPPAEFASAPVRAAGTRTGTAVVMGFVGVLFVVLVGLGIADANDASAPERDGLFPPSCPVDEHGSPVDPEDEVCREIIDEINGVDPYDDGGY